MKKKNINIILYFILIIFTSCNIFKRKIQDENVVSKELSVHQIIDTLQNNYIVFNTFSSVFSGKYQNENRNISLKGNIRIIKDSLIWISVRTPIGTEAVRFYITTDSIKMINRLNKEYMIDNINFFEKKLNIKLNFNHIESLLLNRMLKFSDKRNNYVYKPDSCQLISVKDSDKQKISQLVRLSENKNIIVENNITVNNNIGINLNYSEFKNIQEKMFPERIEFKIKNKGKAEKVILLYKNITLNKDINTSFNIPETYKRIRIE